MKDAAELHAARVEKAVSILIDPCNPLCETPEDDPLHVADGHTSAHQAFATHQLSLPLKLGGCGIYDARELLPACYVGGWADFLSFMHARPQLSPAVQPLLTRAQLESASHPVYVGLRAAWRMCGESLQADSVPSSPSSSEGSSPPSSVSSLSSSFSLNSASPSQRSTDASTPGGIAGTPDSAADTPLSPVRSWEIGLETGQTVKKWPSYCKGTLDRGLPNEV